MSILADQSVRPSLAMCNTPVSSLWERCLTHFKAKLSDNEFRTWISPLHAEVMDKERQLLLTAPNRYIQEFFEQRYLSQVKKLVDDMDSAFTVVLAGSKPINRRASHRKSSKQNFDTEKPLDHQGHPIEPHVVAEESTVESPARGPSPKTRTKAGSLFDDKTGLNRSLTFETLVTGKANELACSAAEQVLLHPGKIYNPLFIYGSTSLGKTHLIQAIGNEIARTHPNFKIRYIESESFYREYSRAIGRNNIDDFKRYFHSLDFFLIDDIQFLGKKFSTQDEFFHTFNTLLSREKQIIITSDTYPKDIQDLKERVVSRFGGGLTVMLEPPELEMRVDILHKKSSSPEIALHLTNEAAFFIARHIRSNARELEGALNKVKAFVAFSYDDHRDREIGIEIIREALGDILRKHNALITIESIQKTVADYYRIKVSDLYAKTRQQRITRPRQIAMALARDITQYSLPQIGESFGGRDHTTVIHACKTVENLRAQDASINHDYHVLRQTLKGGDD